MSLQLIMGSESYSRSAYFTYGTHENSYVSILCEIIFHLVCSSNCTQLFGIILKYMALESDLESEVCPHETKN